MPSPTSDNAFGFEIALLLISLQQILIDWLIGWLWLTAGIWTRTVAPIMPRASREGLDLDVPVQVTLHV